MLDFNQWCLKAETMVISHQAIIDGQARDALSGKTFDCISPIDGSVLTKVALCEKADVELAVSAARNAFETGVWSELAPVDRKAIMLRFADLIGQHREELALLETLDMGKPIADAYSLDVPEAQNCIAWNAEAIDKLYDEIAPTSSDQLGLVTREPLGVIAAIVPWNFPMAMACWKLGPALATGNSVILKPSEKSPLSAIRLGELALEAGIPAGVFNVLPGFGKEVGEPLAQHMDVDGLVFTGSTAVGKHLLAVAASTNMKRTFVECGGKSPNIVFADAPDIQDAAETAADAIFFNQGEVCVAGSRLLVEESIAEDFIARVCEAAQQYKVGNPLDPETTMGAIVDQQQIDTVLSYIEKGRLEGAELLTGGEKLEPVAGGFYMQPTLFSDVTPEMTIVKEEIFGPVLSCMTFANEEEAIQLANDSEYGLAAGLWTSNLSRAHRVSRKLKAGSVWVNCYDTGDMTAPFGGYKQSGNGRDKSLHALEKYTEIKATWIKLD